MALSACKRQEKLLDDEIARVNTVLPNKNKQGELGL